MPRPRKFRYICCNPGALCFEPGMEIIPDSGPSNILELEELEALRLKDLEGLDQTECAEKMQISRPTFQRILLSARKKVSDSLVYGKKIIIRSEIEEMPPGYGQGRCARSGGRGFGRGRGQR